MAENENEGAGEEPPGLTAREAAAQLSLTVSTVYRAVVDKQLLPIAPREHQRGGAAASRYYFTPEAVAEYGEWRATARRRDRLIARILRDLAAIRAEEAEPPDEAGYWDDVFDRLARMIRINRHAQSESHPE